ncbi:hypothetical protein [Verrucosispora sioxanthis]|uniref:Uncharacterized protein n=1 Tax=Verrucosispora sioxanthis TaxID=2499994 RepID=A0A6M1LCV0_9ACTN|nr:hypothetical protein [Verrucosispora sioxanthis]NEE67015.1 hypothetical protein [Verrucosispora sioxanthis]NGM16125.1 hypothetical protein [Verrucosispora sioxanthis]
MRSLAELTDDEQSEAIPEIAAALLNHWNAADTGPNGAGVPTAESTVGGFVRQEVTAMATEESVLAAVRELGVSATTDAWLDLDGVRRPNPLHLLTCSDSPLSGQSMVYFSGHTHGDAHGGNVLVPRHGGESQYEQFLLVDCGGYRDDGALTRDVYFLLLTTLLRTITPHTPDGESGDRMPRNQADALRRYLIDPDHAPPGSLLPWLAQLIEGVHGVGLKYARQADCGLEWRQQRKLALVAHALVCLTFTNLGEPGRRWCWDLAVEALEAYQQALPKEDSATVIPPPVTVPPVFSPPAARTGPHGMSTPGSGLDQQLLTIGHRPLWIHESRPERPLASPAGPTPESAYHDLGLPHPTVGDASARWPTNPIAGPVGADAVAAAPVGTGVVGSETKSLPDRSTPRNPAPRPRQPHDGRSAGPAQPPRRRLRLPHLRTLAVPLASLVSVAGAVGLVPLIDRRNDNLDAPTQTISPSRAPSSASSRNSGARSAPLPDTLQKLADYVATLPEDPPQGRYACAQYEVKSWSGDPEDPELISYHRYELWFTPERSGKRVETEFREGTPVGTITSVFSERRMTDVMPMPADGPEALRDQLRQEFQKQPPELRDAAGLMRLVVGFYQFHPLDPMQRSVLLRELARTPGIDFVGRYVDEAGQRGAAFRAEDREGRQDTLLFDATGRLLSYELSRDDVLLSQHRYLVSTRTNTMDDPCG